MTLFLMCKMIIHYRTYLQNGITNTLAMPNNFYGTSNQIQTQFNCYFSIVNHYNGCTTTPWFLNWMTLFLMCNMIIHYRTYLQNGITNTLAMPNNFYVTSNQIQTPFNCYFSIVNHHNGCTTTSWFLNWMTLFLMCKMIIHYRSYLQNGITNTLEMPNNFYITSNQIQTPFNYHFDTYSDKVHDVLQHGF